MAFPGIESFDKEWGVCRTQIEDFKAGASEQEGLILEAMLTQHAVVKGDDLSELRYLHAQALVAMGASQLQLMAFNTGNEKRMASIMALMASMMNSNLALSAVQNTPVVAPELVDLEAQVAELRRKNNAFKRMQEEWEETSEQNNINIAKFQEALVAAKARANKAEQELTAAKENIGPLEDRVAVLESQLQEKTAALKVEKSAETALEAAAEDMPVDPEMLEKIAALELELQANQDLLEAQRAELVILQEENHAFAELLAQADQAIEDAEAKLVAMEDSLDEARSTTPDSALSSSDDEAETNSPEEKEQKYKNAVLNILKKAKEKDFLIKHDENFIQAVVAYKNLTEKTVKEETTGQLKAGFKVMTDLLYEIALDMKFSKKYNIDHKSFCPQESEQKQYREDYGLAVMNGLVGRFGEINAQYEGAQNDPLVLDKLPCATVADDAFVTAHRTTSWGFSSLRKKVKTAAQDAKRKLEAAITPGTGSPAPSSVKDKGTNTKR